MYEVYCSWSTDNKPIRFCRYSQMMTWFDTLRKNNPFTKFAYILKGKTMFIRMI